MGPPVEPDPAEPAGVLDDRTRELGLRRIEELRDRQGWRGHRTTPTVAEVAEPVPSASPVDTRVEFTDPAVMAMMMAAGAERERLTARVDELEAQVRRLRRALGTALGTIGDALSGIDVQDASADQTPVARETVA